MPYYTKYVKIWLSNNSLVLNTIIFGARKGRYIFDFINSGRNTPSKTNNPVLFFCIRPPNANMFWCIPSVIENCWKSWKKNQKIRLSWWKLPGDFVLDDSFFLFGSLVERLVGKNFQSGKYIWNDLWLVFQFNTKYKIGKFLV